MHARPHPPQWNVSLVVSTQSNTSVADAQHVSSGVPAHAAPVSPQTHCERRQSDEVSGVQTSLHPPQS